VLTVIAVGLGSVLLIVAGMLLRPRLARRLSQPAPRPTIVAGAEAARAATADPPLATDMAADARGTTRLAS
jgi:hypothetical protein